MTEQSTNPMALAALLLAAVASTQKKHERAELLAAYRLRHRWKASDVPRLRTLNLSAVAVRRAAKLRGRGRPVVAAHIDPLTAILAKLSPLVVGFRFDAPRMVRLRAIKEFRWWPHYVEAVYRGEYEAVKASGTKSAAEVTENRIADALGISSAVVRKLCTKVRKIREADFDEANFPPASLAGLMKWINEGRRDDFLPLDEVDSSGAPTGKSRPAVPLLATI